MKLTISKIVNRLIRIVVLDIFMVCRWVLNYGKSIELCCEDFNQYQSQVSQVGLLISTSIELFRSFNK